MQIRIPDKVVEWWDRFHEWSYTPLYSWRWVVIRRIDPFILIMGIICTVYYYWVGGWKTAITGLLMYIFVGMVALWIL